MLACARGRLGDDAGHSCGAAFRNDDPIRAGGIGRAKNGTQVVWIFHAIEHDDQGMSAALGLDHVVEAAVLLCGCDRHYPLMSRVAGKTVEFRALQKPHRHAQLTALLDDALQAQVMAFLGQSHPLEGTSASLDRLTDRVNTVDVVHGMSVYRKLRFMAGF